MGRFRGFRTQSARLPTWDYRSKAWYFVTICTDGRRELLGKVVEGRMQLSNVGEIVREEWLRTPEIRSEVSLDEWVIMPNHIHGIVILDGSGMPVETSRRDVSTAAEREPAFRLLANSLGSTIGQFKSVATKRVRRETRIGDFSWQPRFYDHIIRADESLDSIREYIRNNPLKWHLDKDNPANLYM